jgi:hypothetical protein
MNNSNSNVLSIWGSQITLKYAQRGWFCHHPFGRRELLDYFLFLKTNNCYILYFFIMGDICRNMIDVEIAFDGFYKFI